MRGPSYLELGDREVGRRAAELTAVYECCCLCPWLCGVDRTMGEKVARQILVRVEPSNNKRRKDSSEHDPR